jgi:hypothetical protein
MHGDLVEGDRPFFYLYASALLYPEHRLYAFILLCVLLSDLKYGIIL